MFARGSEFRAVLASAVVTDDIEQQLLFTELYDEHYGICNHSQAEVTDPMSLIGMHAKEDRYTHSLADTFLRDYIQYKVFEFSGIGYRDFKTLPWHETQEVFEKARERIAKESKIIDSLQQSVDKGKD